MLIAVGDVSGGEVVGSVLEFKGYADLHLFDVEDQRVYRSVNLEF